MATLELAVRVPAGQESAAADALVARIPSGTATVLLRFAAALVARLESAEHSVVVLDLPAPAVAKVLADLGR